MRRRHRNTSYLMRLSYVIILIVVGLLVFKLQPKIVEQLHNMETTAPSTSNTDKTDVSELVKVPFVRVIDGDTIVVLYEGKETSVRLIGVNAPESVASDEYLDKTGKENTEEGKAASEWAKDFLKNVSFVQLEFDQEKYDDYDRLLAYVYVGNKMLNEELLRAGHAELMIIEPNTKYKSKFERIQ